MPSESNITTIAHVIQLAIAPVFLLSGVGTLLTVLTNRLGRIIDRARVLEKQIDHPADRSGADVADELKRLSARARLINFAINFSTICALLICVVIATLFLGTFLTFDLSRVIGVIFIASMLSLFLALLTFLREIFIATRGLRIISTIEPRGTDLGKRRGPVVRE